MPSRLITRMIARAPGLRRLPMFKLIAFAEIALLARRHLSRLTPVERRRLIRLVREGRAGGRTLSPGERDERAALIAKVEPRRFAGMAADRLSPVPLPRRVVHGSRRGG